MANNEKSQYLIRISAENLKNVKVIDFMPNRYITKISGANGAGKSSALDAVFNALAPRKTLSPALIRQGQKKGMIRVETNTHIITRKLDEKGGTLTIEEKGRNTLLKAPDDWLEGIAGELGFDPLRFMRMKPEDQFEVLQNLVPMDANIDDLEARNDADAETVKARKAEAKRLEAARDHITVEKDLPTEPINIEALLEEARAVTEHNREIEEKERARNQQRADRDRLVRRGPGIQEEIRKLREALAQVEQEAEENSKELEAINREINGWQPLPEPKDRRALDDKISAASADNSRISTNNANRQQKERFESDIDQIKDDLKRLEAAIRERKITIARTLEQAKFPIAGLSFETEEVGTSNRERKNPKKIVTFNGIPLADASTAEQIRVSTAIGMAGKPDLRFLVIREGSLLDDNGMAILEQMAHENDWQMLVEVVDTSGKVGIFMEDGTVKAVNPETPAAAAPAPRSTTRSKKNKEQGELIK